MANFALYRAFDAAGLLLYVGQSKTLATRLGRHAAKSPWFGEVTRIDIQWFETEKQVLRAEANAIQNEGPVFNVAGANRRKQECCAWGVRVRDGKFVGFDGWYQDFHTARKQETFHRIIFEDDVELVSGEPGRFREYSLLQKAHTLPKYQEFLSRRMRFR